MIQILKYQKSLVLQPEHKAVSLTDQRDLAGIGLKPKHCFRKHAFSEGYFLLAEMEDTQLK